MTKLKRRSSWIGEREQGMVKNGREEKRKGGGEIHEFVRKGSSCFNLFILHHYIVVQTKSLLC